MDYQQSRAYVKDADRYAGGALDLTNIKELMKRLGNPQDQLKYVHVAGTNGKGSVIAYLYTTLSEAGYRVGRYISPSVYFDIARYDPQAFRQIDSMAQEYIRRIEPSVIKDHMGKKSIIAHSITWYKSDSIKRLIKSMDIYLLKEDD